MCILVTYFFSGSPLFLDVNAIVVTRLTRVIFNMWESIFPKCKELDSEHIITLRALMSRIRTSLPRGQQYVSVMISQNNNVKSHKFQQTDKVQLMLIFYINSIHHVIFENNIIM